jgi:type II secretory ATPase GspE/PulE/Tfp pilus assembly ATPase PilB-like protein
MAEVGDENLQQTGEEYVEEIPLGERLLEKGVLSEDQLRIALVEQEADPSEPLGRVLVKLGFVSESTIRDVLSESKGAQSIDLTNVSVDPTAIGMVPIDIAKRYNVFPVGYDEENNILSIAAANPDDLLLFDQLQSVLEGSVGLDIRIAGESEISRSVDEFYGLELSIEGILREIETGEADASYQAGGEDSTASPMVRLVNAFLLDAVKRVASDIHFEPEESFLRVRYRIDGVLRQIRSLHRTYWDSMAVRLKVMSGMNIAESRTPQDGRITMSIYGRTVDFRVACQPTAYGENFVLRILDQQRALMPIDQLGLNDRAQRMLELMISRPEGVIMVTGPTGSGKTTTLYSIINHLNSESVNIMTLEDPIEYPMHMIRQSAVNEASKMDWASGIKSMMRQDPDIILIGEVRDSETADQALRAAMTGHQVLTTLHTNNALGVIPRLLDMGVLPDIMAGNVIGVVAQRLVRRLCLHCKAPKQAEDLELQILRHFIADPNAAQLYQPVGCVHCDYLGYKGRCAIIELLKFNEDIDELVSARASLRELKAKAMETGVFIGMAQNSMEKVLEGMTTIDEVARVCDLTGYLGA